MTYKDIGSQLPAFLSEPIKIRSVQPEGQGQTWPYSLLKGCPVPARAIHGAHKKSDRFLQVCTPAIGRQWVNESWDDPYTCTGTECMKCVYLQKIIIIKKLALPRKMFHFSLTILWSSAKLSEVMPDKLRVFLEADALCRACQNALDRRQQRCANDSASLLQMGGLSLHGICKNSVAMRIVKKK